MFARVQPIHPSVSDPCGIWGLTLARDCHSVTYSRPRPGPSTKRQQQACGTTPALSKHGSPTASNSPDSRSTRNTATATATLVRCLRDGKRVRSGKHRTGAVVLVGRDQPLAGWVDGEVAGAAAAGARPAHHRPDRACHHLHTALSCKRTLLRKVCFWLAVVAHAATGAWGGRGDAHRSPARARSTRSNHALDSNRTHAAPSGTRGCQLSC